jgi:hypothetical protein
VNLRNARAFTCDVGEKEGKLSEWAQDEYVRNSVRKLVAVEANTAVSGDEIRAAASSDPYPVWIYGALITPEEPATAAVGGVPGKYNLLNNMRRIIATMR